MSLRDVERASIEAFVQAAANRGCFTGRVLDFGAGKQPYRRIVEGAGADYVPYDRMNHPASVVTTDVGADSPLWIGTDPWDAILCTQVIQYIAGHSHPGHNVDDDDFFDGPTEMLADMYSSLNRSGYLVITGPTNWPIVETQDLHRFTVEGIVSMLNRAGFDDIDCHYRASVEFEGERWPLGWGAVARKATA